ncbi:MAG: hypothetical protein E7642_07940 [Ruminococcaceae bacterium]|nr:hypothetical protein [Oscillospiraceae bacterium]
MKKLSLIFISTILLLSMALSLVGCNSDQKDPAETPTAAATEAPTDKPTEKPTQKPTEKPTEKPVDKEEGGSSLSYTTYDVSEDWKHFKLVGRTFDVAGGVACDFTASGIEFEGVMSEKVTLSLSCDRDTYFTVYIDGERVEQRIFANKNTTEITIANFEDEGEHHIRVLKQTEPQWSLCVLKELTVCGRLNDAPAKKDKYIEVIGDSITCGYGNLKIDGVSNSGALYQDGTQTYAFLAAEALGADASIVGCSGIGIDKGWTDFSESDFYPKASFYRDRTGADYNFFRAPDLVIINLGTNDQSRGSTEEDFKAGVRELIEFVRDSYGKDMPVVWAYNMMGNGRFDWTKTVLEEMGGEAAGLYSVELTYNNQGGVGHPTLEAHIESSEILTKFIQDKEILGE